MSQLFNRQSSEKDLIAGMQKSLVSNQLDNKLSLDKLAKVADYIGAAAELLDDTGFTAEAAVLTKVLQKLAGDDKKHIQDMIDEELNGPVTKDVIIDEEPFNPFADQQIDVEELGAKPLDLENDFNKPEASPEFLQFKSMPAAVAPKNVTPEYMQFQSIAAKIAKNKKKV